MADDASQPRRAAGRHSLVTLPEHDCPYLPGRRSVSEAFYASSMEPAEYHALLDAGFRRSGRVVYRPTCDGCRACVPIRIAVATFAASKSQRRAWRKNADLRVEVGEPTPTAEKFALYQRYQSEWHGKADDESADAFVSFLYDSPVNTREFCYRDGAGKLLAVGICDEAPGQSLSSVYLYHDPAAAARGVGTYSALFEIEYARAHGLPYWYLGFWVDGCAAMAYKAGFRPHELLVADGAWGAVGGGGGPD